MARLNARLFARLEEERGGRRRATIFAFPQQMAALRDRLDPVRQRRLFLDARRPADSAARRVLHERHAGRHADRSPAGSHRPPVRGGAGGRGASGRPRQSVLRRTAAEERGDRRVGTGRCESTAGDEERGLAARGLRRHRADRGDRPHRLVGELCEQPRVRGAGGDRRRRRCAGRRRATAAASLEALLPLPQCRARGLRFGEQISGRHAVEDALGAVSRRLGRQCRARRLSARAGQHRACRDSRHASSNVWPNPGRSRKSCTSI